MKTYKVIGIMSGTSLDGLDIAYCKFSKKGSRWIYEISSATTLGYKDDQRKLFSSIMKATAEEFAYHDSSFGKYIGEQVRKFVASKKLKVDFIASHGHTIFHQPSRGFTYQIGSGASIYAASNLPVVSDFRSVDVSLQGQGAPLVPIGDKLLFGNYDFCLNLGGISNISFDYKKQRIAFDISPVNIIMNALAEEKGLTFDKDGKLAAQGTINTDLLDALNSLDFYQTAFPKSLGREWIDQHVFPIVSSSSISIEDKLATFCEHIAIQLKLVIDKALPKSPKKKSTLLITGGGALNKFLISRINYQVKDKTIVVVPDKNTVMFKEALIFAFLGVLRIRNEVNCLKSVTGASKDNIGGALYGKIPA
jgi:anhydro-N-acetylmuramic acid kinase